MKRLKSTMEKTTHITDVEILKPLVLIMILALARFDISERKNERA